MAANMATLARVEIRWQYPPPLMMHTCKNRDRISCDTMYHWYISEKSKIVGRTTLSDLTWRPLSSSICHPWAMHSDTTIPSNWGESIDMIVILWYSYCMMIVWWYCNWGESIVILWYSYSMMIVSWLPNSTIVDLVVGTPVERKIFV